MTTTQQPPSILAVNAPGIPAKMRQLKRWGVWVATWIPERGKYDKRPVHPVTGLGLSSARPDEWATFDQAFAAYHRNPTKYAGLGFVIAKGDGIFCIDLDKCMPGGVPDAKALDVINSVQTFVELSPSGQGAHLWGEGTVSQDCVKGVEVYQGNSPRYVTVTGVALPQASGEWRNVPSPVLESVIDAYGQRRSAADAAAEQAPEILDPLVLPEISEMDLPYTVSDFLTDGDMGPRDRSLMLFQTAIALHNTGLSKQEVYSVMVNNPHTWAAAMGKRNEDEDRALDYLWGHHVVKAKPKSDATRVTLDDFDNLGDEPDMGIPITEQASDADIPASEPAAASMFDDESAHAPKPQTPPLRFKPLQAAQFVLQTVQMTWFARGVLPRAETGVVFGESGAGKSFFVLDLLMAIARGVPWRGNIKVKQANVAYVVAEGTRGFKFRLQAYADHHDIDLADVPFTVVPYAPNLLDKGDTKDLIATIKSLGKIDIIAFDTLAQVTPGADENSAQDMGRALAHCRAIERVTGAMVLLIAHTGKDISRGIRGWSGIKGALDVEILVERAGKHRSATITKMKDGTGEGMEYMFKLDTVEVEKWIDPDDGEILVETSCVVVHGGAPQAKGSGPDKLNRQEHQDAWDNLRRGLELAVELPLATVEKDISDMQKHDSRKERNQAATRILNALIKHRYIEVNNDKVSVHPDARSDAD